MGLFYLRLRLFWLRLVFVTYGCLLGSLLLTVRSFFVTVRSFLLTVPLPSEKWVGSLKVGKIFKMRGSVEKQIQKALSSLSPCGNRCRFSESAICSSRVHPPSEIQSNLKFKALRWRLLRWRLTLSELCSFNFLQTDGLQTDGSRLFRLWLLLKFLDDRHITHLICVCVKHLLCDFLRGCFGPSSCCFSHIKAQNTPQESHIANVSDTD